MGNRYDGVVVRKLASHERNAGTSDAADTPLVIECSERRDGEFLQGFMRQYAQQILEDITTHGAVLFRGFEIRTPADFEQQVLSINGMQGIDTVMMSEAGRTAVEGTRYVLHTSTLFRTGGSFGTIGGFHSENFYVPDVPRYISFFCEKSPLIGGETGFVNLCRVYEALPTELKARLEKQAFFVESFALADVQRRYGLPADTVRMLCEQAGMSVIEEDGGVHALLYKPTVFVHPDTEERALIINFGGELGALGLAQIVQRAFVSDYEGWKWWLHRLVWRNPSVRPLVNWLFVHRNPWRVFVDETRKNLSRKPAPVRREILRTPRVADVLSPQDFQLIGDLIRRHFSSFFWRPGDLIVVDNLKLAHDGMPGLGSRQLRVMLTNPVPVPYGPTESGLHIVRDGGSPAQLGVRLTEAGLPRLTTP